MWTIAMLIAWQACTQHFKDLFQLAMSSLILPNKEANLQHDYGGCISLPHANLLQAAPVGCPTVPVDSCVSSNGKPTLT